MENTENKRKKIDEKSQSKVFVSKVSQFTPTSMTNAFQNIQLKHCVTEKSKLEFNDNDARSPKHDKPEKLKFVGFLLIMFVHAQVQWMRCLV